MAVSELTGTELSEPAAEMMVNELRKHPEDIAIRALQRCAREMKGRLTLADVLSRIEDGHPGAEEAFAKLPIDENMTVVWTEQMQQAYGSCSGLIAMDMVAGRMAFREYYNRLVVEARVNNEPPNWVVSLGHDKEQRILPVQQAIEQGLLSHDDGVKLLPDLSDNEGVDEVEVHEQLEKIRGILSSRK